MTYKMHMANICLQEITKMRLCYWTRGLDVGISLEFPAGGMKKRVLLTVTLCNLKMLNHTSGYQVDRSEI
jgi:hypothetical protein